jgi:hypothetical protein
MRAHRVRALLMGGQACVFYGAAEFSRDTDFVILADPRNLARLRAALKDLQARVVAVPPFEVRFLRRGHAIHFRCRHPEALGMRIDVMSRMRGVDPFPKLWARRTMIALPDGTPCDLLSLPDLVQAKKTQRDKDWPMLRRLLEAHYFQNRRKPTAEKVRFWLRELRTPELLIEVAKAHPRLFSRLAAARPLLTLAAPGQEVALAHALKEEEQKERERDRLYWLPLKSELETLRRFR